MMATRLSDSELAARVRAGNRQRAQRQHERRRKAGLVQLSVWIPEPIRAALDEVAAHRNETVAATVADILERSLSLATLGTATTTAPAGKTTSAELTPDMFLNAPTTSDRDALMQWVGAALEEGHTGADIARQLNASGRRTANGATFNSGNLLRDYRAWKDKTWTD